VLAHQGGWDEILLVLGPIGVVVGLLAVVRSRLRDADPGVESARREPGEAADEQSAP
jgi:hypothetical protein